MISNGTILFCMFIQALDKNLMVFCLSLKEFYSIQLVRVGSKNYFAGSWVIRLPLYDHTCRGT